MKRIKNLKLGNYKRCINLTATGGEYIPAKYEVISEINFELRKKCDHLKAMDIVAIQEAKNLIAGPSLVKKL